MNTDKLLISISNAKSESELFSVIETLRPKATYVKSKEMVNLIDEAIEKCISLDYKRMLVFLYDLKIRQLYHLNSNIELVIIILEEIEYLTGILRDHNCTALFNQLVWHIERLRGNYSISKMAINSAMKLVDKSLLEDNYIINFCKYSYAVEIWLTNHGIESAKLLEECIDFFYEGNYYRSLAQVFGLLSVVYAKLHEGKKILVKVNTILADRVTFANLPRDVKGIIYYSTGLGHMLDANLAIAESYFNEAYTILKPIYKDSIYFANYLVLLSYLSTVRGLQGKNKQATNMIKESDKLLKTEFIKKNLDKNSKKQITHTYNLTKFYNLSRLSEYNSQEHQKLINEIVKESNNLYCDFMTFSEFVLNSDLDHVILRGLLDIDNFSVNRVKHLIKFEIERQRTDISKEQRSLNCIAILKNRVVTTKTSFMEHSYADLLIAQQLFSLKKYAEIAPLLKKYEKRLNQVEVLEMRIFMEAFIQVGAFKSGDPLGPALQYMAIKKCRLYGFSRLENTLLKYLQLQHKEIIRIE